MIREYELTFRFAVHEDDLHSDSLKKMFLDHPLQYEREMMDRIDNLIAEQNVRSEIITLTALRPYGCVLNKIYSIKDIVDDVANKLKAYEGTL